MQGQHPGSKKYWRSSRYAGTADLQYSWDGGRNATFVRWSVHQWWKVTYNQWTDLPNWYAVSQTSRHYIGARPISLTKEPQNVCCLPKKKLRCMILHYHEIKFTKICCCKSCTKLQHIMFDPWFYTIFIANAKERLFSAAGDRQRCFCCLARYCLVWVLLFSQPLLQQKQDPSPSIAPLCRLWRRMTILRMVVICIIWQ